GARHLTASTWSFDEIGAFEPKGADMARFQNVDHPLRELFDFKIRDFSNDFQFFGFGSRFLGPSTVSLPPTTIQVPQSSPLHYFLKIDGVTGDSTDAKHKGEFTVDGFSFGSTDVVNGSGSGAAAGRATFAPLTVDVSSLVGLAPLLADEVTGKVI